MFYVLHVSGIVTANNIAGWPEALALVNKVRKENRQQPLTHSQLINTFGARLTPQDTAQESFIRTGNN